MKQTATLTPVIWFTLFLDSAAAGTALPVVPKLVERLVHGNVPLAASYYGVLLAISGLLLFFFGPVQAVLADYFGRQKMLLVASVGSALSFVGLAFAPNLALLFFAQAVYAISGASYPVATCYVADLSDANSRTKNFSTLSGVLTLGFIVGAALGGLLGQVGLAVAMSVASVSCLLAALLIHVYFTETASLDQKLEARPLPLKDLLSNQVESAKFLFSRSSLSELAIVMVCGDFAFQAFLSTWVLFTTLRFHWSISQAGASLALEGLLSVAVQVVFLQYALPRWGLTKTLLASLFFDALALILYNCVDGSLIVVAVIALHCLGAAVKPACSAALASAVSPAEQTKLQGAIGSQSALSTVAASLLGASCFGFFASSSAPFTFPGISMLVGFVSLVFAMAVILLPHVTVLARNRSAIAGRS